MKKEKGIEELEDCHRRLFEEIISAASFGLSEFILLHTDRVDFLADQIIFSIKSNRSQEERKKRAPLKQLEILKSSDVMTDYWQSYSPFSDLIIEAYSSYTDAEFEELFSSLDIFYNHRQLLRSLIRGEEISRKEDILEDEIVYEKNTIVESFVKMFLNVYCDKTLLLIVDNLEVLPKSTLTILSSLVTKKWNVCKIAIVVLFDKEKLYNREDDFFLKNVSQEKRIVNILFMDETIPGDKDRRREYSCFMERQEGKALIKKLEKAFRLLAFDDCKEFCCCVNERISEKRDYLNAADLLRFRLLHAQTFLMLLEMDSAIMNFKTALKLAEEQRDNHYLALIHYWFGITYFLKGELFKATEQGKICLEIGQEVSDRVMQLRGLLLLYLSENKFDPSNMLHWYQYFRELIAIAEELGWVNTLIYCYTTIPYGLPGNYTKYYDHLQTKGIQLAKKRNYLYRLANAYQTKGTAYAVNGKYKAVFHCYKKSLYYKKVVKDIQGLPYIYNGIGSYYYLTGSYEKALSCYFRSLSYLRRHHDYSEVAMTFLNLSLCYYMMLCEDMSLHCLENMNRIMNRAGIEKVMSYSKSGIGVLISLIAALNGNFVKAYQHYCVLKDEEFLLSSTKSEEFFMYEFLKALFLVREYRYEEAIFHMKEAEKHLYRKEDVIRYHSPRFYFEYAKVCEKMGDSERYDSVLEKGLSEAVFLKNHFFISIFQKLFAHEKIHLNWSSLRRKINISSWLQAANLGNNIRTLQKRINEINLLNKLQHYYVLPISIPQLISDVILVIRENLSLASVCFFQKIDGKWEYQCCAGIEKKISVDSFEDFLQSSSRKILLKRRNECPFLEGVNSILVLPLEIERKFSGAFLFMASDEFGTEINSNDFKILDIIIQQLKITLEKKLWEKKIVEQNKNLENYNKQLLVMATTDRLTGVSNRQALYKKLQEEEEKMRRDLNKKGLAVLFLDLDNFKYYNDTFGHELGDYLLTKFADILKNAVRNIDFIARYGGDEFVLLLPETDFPEARAIAQRILEDVGESNHFRDHVCRYLEKEVMIPEERQLSVSIGISRYERANEISLLISFADKALYEAKRSGKGRYVVYSP